MKIKVLLILLGASCLPVFSGYKIVKAQVGKNILKKNSPNPYEYLKLYLEIREIPKTRELPLIPETQETHELSDSKIFAVVLSKFINYSDAPPKMRYANDEKCICLQSIDQVIPELFSDWACDPQNQKLLEKPFCGHIGTTLKKSLFSILNSIAPTTVPLIDGKADIDKLKEYAELIGTEINTVSLQYIKERLITRP